MDTVALRAVRGQRADSVTPGQTDAMETDGALHIHEQNGNVPTDTSTESRLIMLNVGGQKMMTSRATFAAAPAGSLLGRMFGPDADPLWTPPRLADGSYFLDLNPYHFAIVLDVLRHGPAVLYPVSPADRGAITLVADYLGLDLAATTCLAGDVLRYRAAMAPESARFTILAVAPSAFWANRIDLCDWSASSIKATYVSAMRSWTLAEARGMLSSAMGIPDDSVVAHLCLRRRNGTVRPEARLPMDSTTVRLDDVHVFDRMPLVLLVHQETFLANIKDLPAATLCQPLPTAGAPSSQAPESRRPSSSETMVQPPNAPALIFVRCFDRDKGTLSKARPLLVNARDTIAVAVPAMCALLSLSGDRHVHLFEEISTYMVMEVDPTSTFADAEIAYGDILWLEAVHDRMDAAIQQPIDSVLIKRLTRSPSMLS
ncbi:BTB/POZ domain containing protein [Pandoravirus macleodensis]|uniref:BTB/POZ domain containing protein n=1 Tax=Pandoravirus macleodensis TaxID=2107707 RepID=A0A2U7UFD9_9VIRU|nr:BTB/POZ domain containing protein [Pandoravirus macleodensis]AVK77085.1 BTB/POZ domain containing protein [Pandoravirus macleodensis]